MNGRTVASPHPKSLLEVTVVFLRLGLVSFGGPAAHLGYFQREFVERRRWLDDEAYGDLVALSQFLPGPASSQVAFGIGMFRAGLPGGVAASVGFMLPSAVAMILFAYGVGSLGDLSAARWLHGLKLAAVAVVALAVWQMGRRLCPDWPRRFLALAAAAAVLVVPGAATQVGAIAACAFIAWIGRSGPRSAAVPLTRSGTAPRPRAAAPILIFLLLLLFLPVAARMGASRSVAVFDSFYRAGSLVFGGGHVVLPMLRSELVPRGWIRDDTFLAGYGAVQAVPGPLFTFAGYLGTLIQSGPDAWTGGVLALFAIFLPGWLLVAGTLPFWHRVRGRAWAQAALAGANAAVVGILLAALYRPLCTDSLRGAGDGAAAAAAIVLVGKLRVPPWALVAVMAAAGEWILR